MVRPSSSRRNCCRNDRGATVSRWVRVSTVRRNRLAVAFSPKGEAGVDAAGRLVSDLKSEERAL